MYTDDDQLQAISKFISRGLKLCGKSAFSSRISKTQTVILDTILTSWERSKVTVFHGGSMAEGTAIASSDMDRMAVVSGIEVVMTEKFYKTNRDLGHRNLFLVDSTKSNPGYVRLKAVPSRVLNHEVFCDFSSVLDKDTDGLYLFSDKFVEFLHSETKPPSPGESKFYYRHGPCLMVEHQNIFGYYRNTPYEHLETTDVAFALVCDQWPEEVHEWMTRPRHHNWPDLELVTKISQQDCHVVPVGDPTSPVCSQE